MQFFFNLIKDVKEKLFSYLGKKSRVNVTYNLLKLVQLLKEGNWYEEKKKTYRTLHLRERNKLATQWVHLVSCHLLHVHYVMLSPALGLYV